VLSPTLLKRPAAKAQGIFPKLSFTFFLPHSRFFLKAASEEAAALFYEGMNKSGHVERRRRKQHFGRELLRSIPGRSTPWERLIH